MIMWCLRRYWERVECIRNYTWSCTWPQMRSFQPRETPWLIQSTMSRKSMALQLTTWKRWVTAVASFPSKCHQTYQQINSHWCCDMQFICCTRQYGSNWLGRWYFCFDCFHTIIHGPFSVLSSNAAAFLIEQIESSRGHLTRAVMLESQGFECL